ncbi:mucin-1-like [Pollicipes pollicipes]|uniref:mucin-1-like n=1 Tax=Pollicipes pollicipes TaxID=41117 RepID=UPI0018858AD3|nr:mucin-1-like [Pollicipes pollicipes]
MLESTDEVHDALKHFHIRLMRKARRQVKPDLWEKALISFCRPVSKQDAWELERFGYKQADLAVKLRVLKNLCEVQFDRNKRFKDEVNKEAACELRLQPLGRDRHGNNYWYQLDEDCQLRIYKEDIDDETWQVVAEDRESMKALIQSLQSDSPLGKSEDTSQANSEEELLQGPPAFKREPPDRPADLVRPTAGTDDQARPAGADASPAAGGDGGPVTAGTEQAALSHREETAADGEAEQAASSEASKRTKAETVDDVKEEPRVGSVEEAVCATEGSPPAGGKIRRSSSDGKLGAGAEAETTAAEEGLVTSGKSESVTDGKVEPEAAGESEPEADEDPKARGRRIAADDERRPVVGDEKPSAAGDTKQEVAGEAERSSSPTAAADVKSVDATSHCQPPESGELVHGGGDMGTESVSVSSKGVVPLDARAAPTASDRMSGGARGSPEKPAAASGEPSSEQVPATDAPAAGVSVATAAECGVKASVSVLPPSVSATEEGEHHSELVHSPATGAGDRPATPSSHLPRSTGEPPTEPVAAGRPGRAGLGEQAGCDAAELAVTAADGHVKTEQTMSAPPVVAEPESFHSEETGVLPEPITETVVKPEPAVKAVPEAAPVVDSMVKAEPAVEVAVGPEAALKVVTDPEPAVEAVINLGSAVEAVADTEPAAEALADTEPAVEAVADTEPAVEAVADTEPAVEAAADTGPAVEAASDTEPAAETVADTEPAVEAVADTEPGVEAMADTEPAVEPVASTGPTVEVLASAEPAVEAVADPEPAVKAVVNRERDMEPVADTEPAVEAAADIEPAVEAVADTEPAVEAGADTGSTVEAVTSTGPIVEAVASSEAAVEALASSEPAVEAVANIEPAVEALAHTELAVETVTDNEPPVEAVADTEVALGVLANNEPPVEAVADTKPTVEAVASTEPAVEAMVDTEEALVDTEKVVADAELAVEAVVDTKPAVEAVVGTEPAVQAVVDTEPAVEAVANPSEIHSQVALAPTEDVASAEPGLLEERPGSSQPITSAVRTGGADSTQSEEPSAADARVGRGTDRTGANSDTACSPSEMEGAPDSSEPPPPPSSNGRSVSSADAPPATSERPDFVAEHSGERSECVTTSEAPERGRDISRCEASGVSSPPPEDAEARASSGKRAEPCALESRHQPVPGEASPPSQQRGGGGVGTAAVGSTSCCDGDAAESVANAPDGSSEAVSSAGGPGPGRCSEEARGQSSPQPGVADTSTVDARPEGADVAAAAATVNVWASKAAVDVAGSPQSSAVGERQPDGTGGGRRLAADVDDGVSSSAAGPPAAPRPVAAADGTAPVLEGESGAGATSGGSAEVVTSGADCGGAVEEPALLVSGSGSGADCEGGVPPGWVSEAVEEPALLVSGSGSGADCEGGVPPGWVSEAVEEPALLVSGSGSGADCEGGVPPGWVSEAVEEPALVVAGSGWGALCGVGNGVQRRRASRSAAGNNGHAEPPSADRRDNGEADQPQAEPEAEPEADPEADPDPEPPAGKKRGRKRKSELESLVSADADADEGGAGRRRSSRVAKLREKEEEQRRVDEEQRLRVLKEQAVLRKLRQHERETRRAQRKDKKKKRRQKKVERGQEQEQPTEKAGKKKRKKKKKKRAGNDPWLSSSDTSSSSDEDEEMELFAHHEAGDEDPFRSDHEFSPEVRKRPGMGGGPPARVSSHASTVLDRLVAMLEDDCLVFALQEAEDAAAEVSDEDEDDA